MAVEMAKEDQKNGLTVAMCDTTSKDTWGMGMDADIHVVHSHVPDEIAYDRQKKIITVQHGSPEYIFESSVADGIKLPYGASNPFAMNSFYMTRSNALVTFWDRQAKIWETMTDKPVYCIPMGVDREFWTSQGNKNCLNGAPAIFTAENCHTCKWPLDMFIMWPKLVERFTEARLHAIHIPMDQHRWWLPLSYMNGSQYTAFISPARLSHPVLRDFLSSAHYYYSPVTYGDHNRMCLEAASCGTKIISFRGNQYAHYWITEGNQWDQLEEWTNILTGETPAREPETVPDIKDTGVAMLHVYKEILTNGA